MSTAVAKHCDWSLGFDEKGPVFDGAQDWRHSVFLTRRAERKEVYFASEVLAEMWPSVPSTLPRSLWTVEMDSLRRPIVTLSDSFNLCQAVKSDKGTGSDKRLRIVTAMLRQVFCGAQGATLAFVTTATMLADALTKALLALS